MSWAIVIVLAGLWAVLMGSANNLGGYVHVLLVAAILLGAYQVVQRRRERNS